MSGRDEIRSRAINQTMSDAEEMWLSICNNVEDERVDMLVHAMISQHALVMEGESNANALMALIGFLSQQVLQLHQDVEMGLESAMVLLQIGMQRGVQAQITVKEQKGKDLNVEKN